MRKGLRTAAVVATAVPCGIVAAGWLFMAGDKFGRLAVYLIRRRLGLEESDDG